MRIGMRMRMLAPLVLAGVLSACGGSASTPAQSTAASGTLSSAAVPAAAPASAHLTKVTFLTNFLPGAQVIPFFLAAARGYYRQAGLDVNIIDGKATGLTVQQVASGSVDFGYATLDVMALDRAKGAPLLAVMGAIQSNPYGVWVPRNSPIKTFKQLVGHRLLIVPGAPSYYYLKAVAHIKGFDAARIRYVSLSPSALYGSYFAKQANAVTGDLGFGNALVQAHRPSRILSFFKAGVISPGYGVLVRQDYAKAHPAVVRAFVAASVKAWEACLANPAVVTQAIDDMIRARPGMSLNAKEILGGWDVYHAYLNTARTKGKPFGWESTRDWQDALQLLHQDAGLNGSLNPSDYFTNAYLPAQ